MKRIAVVVGLLLCGVANASLEDDGIWKAGVWATTVWTDGVWFEGTEPTVVVPNVIGLSLAAADTALEAESLDTGSTSSTCSDATLDEVVSQAPPAGVVVPEGTTVDLIASSGVECTGAGGKLKLKLNLRLQ